MDIKYARLVSRDRTGDLKIVHPEIDIDTAIDPLRQSEKPVCNYAIGLALDETFSNAMNALSNAFNSEDGLLKWDGDAGAGYIDFSAIGASAASALASALVPSTGALYAENGKIKFDPSKLKPADILSLCSPDGGIAASTEAGENLGKLSVDYSNLTPAHILALFSTNGGITDSAGTGADSGKLSVDFSMAPLYRGATSSSSGTAGYVPPAQASERNKFLMGDGTWQEVVMDIGSITMEQIDTLFA